MRPMPQRSAPCARRLGRIQSAYADSRHSRSRSSRTRRAIGRRLYPRVASRREIAELLGIAAQGKIRSPVERFRLDDINTALARLEQGTLAGRAVICPA